MKRIIILILTLTMIVSVFAGCTDNNADDITKSNTSASSNTTTSAENMAVDIAEYSDEELNSSYDESDAVIINLNDNDTSVQGSGAAYKDGVVNILNAGTYILRGTLNGQITVNATNVDEVQIVLDNANIKNNQGSAIYISQAEKVTITLADNSTNTIIDGSSYSDTSDDAPDAAIYSDDDLVINGTGALVLEGNYKHGIKTSDDLSIISGNISITAVNDGIRGKDSVAVLDGSITVSAGGDGITSTNAEDSDKGWISIDGGVFNINAGNNGFQAESALVINAGEVNVTAGQDTYHCNNDISISGGVSNLAAGDDGMHADNNLQISAGTIDVVSNYEGIEGNNVYITGGTIDIVAVDDGINAAGGSDADTAPNDRFAETPGDNEIIISGGDVYIEIIGTEGDGIDSNGSIYLKDGILEIDGGVCERDAALDVNEATLEFSGGILASVGSTGNLVIPTTVDQPLISIIFDSNQQAGETIDLVDSSGNTLLSFTPKRMYQVVMLSCPELTVGKTYTVLKDGSELFTVTIDMTSIIVDGNGNATENTYYFNHGGGMPGQGGGGGRGEISGAEGDFERPDDGGSAGGGQPVRPGSGGR